MSLIRLSHLLSGRRTLLLFSLELSWRCVYITMLTICLPAMEQKNSIHLTCPSLTKVSDCARPTCLPNQCTMESNSLCSRILFLISHLHFHQIFKLLIRLPDKLSLCNFGVIWGILGKVFPGSRNLAPDSCVVIVSRLTLLLWPFWYQSCNTLLV